MRRGREREPSTHKGDREDPPTPQGKRGLLVWGNRLEQTLPPGLRRNKPH